MSNNLMLIVLAIAAFVGYSVWKKSKEQGGSGAAGFITQNKTSLSLVLAFAFLAIAFVPDFHDNVYGFFYEVLDLPEGIFTLGILGLAGLFGYLWWKEKQKSASSRLPVPAGKKKYVLIAVVLVVVAIGAGIINLDSLFGGKEPIEVFDDYPIWLMDDGEVAVYREMVAYEDTFETNIVLANLSDEDKDGTYEIYHVVPKEMAESASQLKFSKKPTIIEDDPVLKFEFDQGDKQTITFKETFVDLPILLGKITITWGRDLVAGYVLGICKTPEAQKWIKANKASYEEYDIMPCIRYVERMNRLAQRSSEEWQRKNLKENEVLKSLEPGDDEYSEVKSGIQRAVVEEEKAKNPLRGVQESIKNIGQNLPLVGKGRVDIKLSEDIFPDELGGNSLVETKSPAVEGSCYAAMPPEKYVSAVYGTSSEPMAIAITEYENKNNAQAMVRLCTQATEDMTGKPEGLGYFTAEKQKDVSGFPFYIVTTTLDGKAMNALSFLVVDKYLVAFIYPSGTGGSESLHRNTMYDMAQVMTGKSRSATTPKSTPRSTPKPTPRRTSTPRPTTTTRSGSGCMVPALSNDYTTYYYHKSSEPCTDYVKSTPSLQKFSMKCKQSVARWRGHYVKEINTKGADKLNIQAKLELNDSARFFRESGGVGVKYDDYVDLIILKSDPRSELNRECNRASSQANWAKCAISKDHPDALGHCGVPKYKSSATCNFNVTVGGPGYKIVRVYAVLRIADAWPANVEGVIKDMKICYD